MRSSSSRVHSLLRVDLGWPVYRPSSPSNAPRVTKTRSPFRHPRGGGLAGSLINPSGPSRARSASITWSGTRAGRPPSQISRRTPYRNGFQRACFSPALWNSGVEKAHGRIEWRAIDVLPAEPPGFKASGRRFGKSVASYVRAKSRRTASGRSHSTRSSISSPACPPPPRHRRCWASIAIIGGSACPVKGTLSCR